MIQLLHLGLLVTDLDDTPHLNINVVMYSASINSQYTQNYSNGRLSSHLKKTKSDLFQQSNDKTESSNTMPYEIPQSKLLLTTSSFLLLTTSSLLFLNDVVVISFNDVVLTSFNVAVTSLNVFLVSFNEADFFNVIGSF